MLTPARRRRSRRLAARGLAGLGSIAIAACTYDFDAFVATGDGGGDGGDGGARPQTGGEMAMPPNGGSGASGGTVPEGGDGNGGAGDAGAGVTAGGTSNAGEGGIGPGAAPSDGGAGPAGAAGDGGAQPGGAGGMKSTGGSGSGGFDCSAVSGTVWNDHCYFVTPKSESWVNARATCQGFPAAQLVAIGDEAEQQMIETTFLEADDLWIGLSLADTSANPPASCKSMPATCPFVWVTSEPLGYTKWGAHSDTDREPNYSGACVRIQVDANTWADLQCSTSLPALCESG
jgi:hypothetical protein